MTVTYSFNMEDPRTWSPDDTVKDAPGTYKWLTKHLALFDRLFYTAKNTRITYGFQPFTLAKNKIMEASHIRKLTSHNPTIRCVTKKFKTDSSHTDEFITWVLPDLGCLTIHIHNKQPYRLAYLSKSLLQDREMDHDKVFGEYLDRIENITSADLFSDAMQTFALS